MVRRPLVFPGAGPYGILVGIHAGLAVVLWWLFFIAGAPDADTVTNTGAVDTVDTENGDSDTGEARGDEGEVQTPVTEAAAA